MKMLNRMTAEGYSFGRFQLDLVRGCLFSEGVEWPLRRQSQLVLAYLLERPGVLVSKDELAAAIWHDTAVTDNALAQCIAEIRRVLHDDPRNPTFVRTVPKVGYRFLADVTPSFPVQPSQALAQIVSEPIPPVQAQDAISALPVPAMPAQIDAVQSFAARGFGAHLRHQLFAPSRRLAVLVASTLILVCGTLGIRVLYFSMGPRVVNAGKAELKPAVAIMYFDNRTGDPSLNWLSEGLADMMIADLGPPQQINVLNREQQHSLFPNAPAHHATSTPNATVIGQRANAGTVVLGTFSGMSRNLQLAFDVFDTKTGTIRAHEQAIVTDPQEIVVQANLLSARLANDMGLGAEPVPNLPDVMTSNIDAYRYYSLGVEKAQNFQNGQAIELLKKATEFDPHFAMAFARIGYAYAVTDFLPGKGRPYLEKSLQLSSGLSDKDRLYVRAWNDIAHGDYTSAADTFHLVIYAYPGESEAYCQLGRLLRGEEKTADAIEIIRRGLESNPKSAQLYNVLGLILMGEHRYAEAIDAEKHAVALSPEDPNAYDSLGMSYEQSGDYYAAISEYSRALAFDPEFESSAGHLGDTYFQQGRFNDAIREYERSIKITKSDTVKAIGYGSLVTIYRAMGNLDAAQTAAGMEIKRDPSAAWDGIFVALDRGDKVRAMALERTLYSGSLNRERGTRPNMRMQFYNQGALAAKRGDQWGAIMNFRAALQHLPASSGIDLHEDCLANAYLRFGMWKEAIAEYERILKENPNYPFAQFHLGEAFANAGDSQHAREAYAHFLQSWQSADPNLHEIQAAKSRIAAAA